jgi:hypothetical protein
MLLLQGFFGSLSQITCFACGPLANLPLHQSQDFGPSTLLDYINSFIYEAYDFNLFITMGLISFSLFC